MSIGQDWIDATRRNLYGGYNEQRNKLNLNYTAGSGTLSFTYPLKNLAAGVTLSIGLNVFYVYDVNVNAQTATVDGGQDGSTDANASSGAIVRVNPKFTDFGIWQALTNDLNDLSSSLNGMFGINITDFNFVSYLTGYDLGTTANTNLLSVYEVKHLTPGPEKDMPRLPSWAWKETRQAVTTDIPSGTGIQLVNTGGLTNGYKVRVVWKSKFIMPTDPTQDISTSLLLTNAYDIPPIGAAISLMAGQEIKRNFLVGEGDMKRAMEVPPGAIQASANGLKQLRHDRINAEAARLLAMYPPYKD